MTLAIDTAQTFRVNVRELLTQISTTRHAFELSCSLEPRLRISLGLDPVGLSTENGAEIARFTKTVVSERHGAVMNSLKSTLTVNLTERRFEAIEIYGTTVAPTNAQSLPEFIEVGQSGRCFDNPGVLLPGMATRAGASSVTWSLKPFAADLGLWSMLVQSATESSTESEECYLIDGDGRLNGGVIRTWMAPNGPAQRGSAQPERRTIEFRTM